MPIIFKMFVTVFKILPCPDVPTLMTILNPLTISILSTVVINSRINFVNSDLELRQRTWWSVTKGAVVMVKNAIVVLSLYTQSNGQSGYLYNTDGHHSIKDGIRAGVVKNY